MYISNIYIKTKAITYKKNYLEYYIDFRNIFYYIISLIVYWWDEIIIIFYVMIMHFQKRTNLKNGEDT